MNRKAKIFLRLLIAALVTYGAVSIVSHADDSRKRKASANPPVTSASKSAKSARSSKPPLASAIPAPQVSARPQVPAFFEGIPPAVRDRKAFQRAWNFFYDRAYPNNFIPADAYQKAHQQLDEMLAAQQQAAKFSVDPLDPAVVANSTTWTLIGPQPIEFGGFNGPVSGTPINAGRVPSIAVDPTNPDIVYIGAASGGIWKTTNGGTNWTPLSDQAASLSIGSIAIAPSNPAILYAGTGEGWFAFDTLTGAGVLKSTDSGATWTQVPVGGAPFVGPFSTGVGAARIGSIAIHPTDPNIVLVAASFFTNGSAAPDGRSGIYRTANGGGSWTRVQGDVTATEVVFKPTDGNIAYGALARPSTGGDVQNGVYRSLNAGATWEKISTGLPAGTELGRLRLALSNSAPSTRLYMSANNAISGSFGNLRGVFVTANPEATPATAVTWAQITGVPNYCNPQCWYDNIIIVDRTNPDRIFLGGAAPASTATNGTFIRADVAGASGATPAATTTNISGDVATVRLHVDHHSAAFSNDGTRLYVGNDGGMYRTDNPGAATPTWSNLNNTLSLAQSYPGNAINPASFDISYQGTQDNSTHLYTGLLQWSAVTCGDGAYNAIDPLFHNVVYANCQQIDIRRSLTYGMRIGAGSSYSGGLSIGINLADGSRFIPPLIHHPTVPGTLFFGTFRVYMSTNRANTWTVVSPDLAPSGGFLSTIEVGGGFVYSGAETSEIFRSPVAGIGVGTWTNIETAPLPNRLVRAIKAVDASTVYAVYSGFTSGADTVGHVFKTINGGVSWTDISGTVLGALPNVPVNDIVVDPDVPGTLYVGTDVGVYFTTNDGASWTPLMTGLPRAQVLSLNLHRPSRILRAGTHGRSTWDLVLANFTPTFNVSQINPVSIARNSVGAPGLGITVRGNGFTAASEVLWGGSTTGVTTTFVSANQLTALVSNTMFGVAGAAPISVRKAGADTNALNFIVTPTDSVVVSPLAVNFGAQQVGTPSAPRQINLTNLSGGTLGSIVGAISGTNAADFSISNPTCPVAPATLPAGTGCSSDVIFNPGGSGNRSALFTFTDTAAGSPRAIPLSGTGQAAAGVVSLAPASFDFLNQTVGVPSAVQNFTLTNNSGSAISSIVVSFTGTNAGDFSRSGGTCTTTLADGANCTIGAIMTAGATGGRSGMLNVAFTGASGSPVTSTLSGNGVAAGVVSLSPASFDFLDQTVGVPSFVQDFTLTNNSGSTISSIVVTYIGANGADYTRSGGTCGASLANGANCTIGTRVTAGATGTRLGTLNVAYTGASGSPVQSSLFATGVTPSGNVTANPTSVNFGTIVWFTGSPAMSVQITNGTANAVNIAGISITGTNREKFFLNTETGSSGCPFGPSTLASGNSCFVDVAFASASITTGTFNGNLTINHSASGSPLNVPLTGTSSSAAIPGPINDNINAAITIEGIPFLDDRFVQPATINTGGITDPAIPASCASGALNSGRNNSIWYKGTPDTNGHAVAHTLFSTYDTILSVWTGTPGSFGATPIVCNDDIVTGTPQSFVEWDLVAGTTYFIMVSSFSGAVVGDEATFFLDFSDTAPANDNSASATQVVLNSPYINTVNSIKATEEAVANDPNLPALGDCNAAASAASGRSNSVWWKFTPGSSGTITANTLGSVYDTILSVFSGSPGALVAVACNDEAPTGLTSAVSFNAVGGTTYFFRVSAFLGDGGYTNFFMDGPAAGGGAPAVTLNPTSVPFGNQAVGATSAATHVSLTNSGTAILNYTSIAKTGANPGDFVLTAVANGATPACVLAGGSLNAGIACNFDVAFAPTTTGAKAASATVTSNAAGSPHSTTLTGTGTQPAVTLNPTNVPFGDQRAGTTSAATHVSLTNSGTATLNYTSIAKTGANPGEFILTAVANGATPACVLAGGSLNAGIACNFDTAFAPTTTGGKSASATVTSNAPGSPHSTTLSGNGTQSILTPNPTSVPFGDVAVLTTSPVVNVQVSNTGGAVLNIATIVKNGTDAAQFNLVAPTAGAPACIFGVNVINPGNSCFFGVSASPTSTGPKVANVALTSDGVVSPVNIPLTANGVQASIAFNPTSLAFGNVRVDALVPPTMSSTLTNNGTSALNFTGITITGADASQFLLIPILGSCAVGVPVPPAGTCFINAGFDPTSTGAKAANASIASNGTPNPALLPLTGTGTAPAVTFIPPAVPFGNQKVGTTSAVAHVALTNSGTATLNYTGIAKTGTDPTQFILTAAANGATPACVLGGGILNPAASCNFDVAFGPTTVGAKSANATVTSDAPNSPHNILLTGTGAVSSPPTFAPTSVPFGTVKVNTTSAKQDVTITNNGTVPIEIVSLSLTGTDPARFALGAPTSGAACPLGASTLPVAGSCKVGITYSPTTPVANSANLAVTDDAAGSPHTVPLTGTGAVASAPTINPTTVVFGTVKVGTTTAVTNVSITGNGPVPLAITSIAKAAIPENSQFTLTSVANGATPACPLGASTLNPGASCNFGVSYSPTTTGPIVGDIKITDDAGGGTVRSVPLNGTGAVPTASLTNSPVNVGTQLVGTTSPAAATPATLTNTGPVPLAITTIVKGGANAADFTLTTGGAACPTGASVLNAGASCTINSTVTPGAIGARVATATITDDSGGVAGATQIVTFNATGVDVALSANPTSQTIVAGQSAAFTITATPSGGGTVAGPVTYSCPGSLPQGVTCSFSPASISNFGTPTNSTLTINTVARTLIVPPAPPSRIIRVLPFTIVLLGLLLIALTLAMKPAKRRRLEFGLAVGLLFVVMGVAVGCSAGDSTGTPPGTTNITVTGAVSGANKTVPITLTVQ